MANIPPDIQDGIKKLSEKADVPVNSLLKRLKEIIDTDESIQSMQKPDFKIRYAWAILYRENAVTGKTVDVYFEPTCHCRARDIQVKGEPTTVGDIAGLIQTITEDENGKKVLGEVEYASGTFWRTGAKNIHNLLVGKVYKSSFIIKENSWGKTISSDRAGFTEVDHKMPTIDEFYATDLKDKDFDITIGEMDLNLKETTTDIRIVTATVVDATVAESADGDEYGKYVLMDDSIAGSYFTIFVDPRDVLYEQGSIIKFGGTGELDKKEKIRWTHQFQIPTDVSMPRELNVKPVTGKQDEVDLSLGDDEQTKKEEPTATPEPEKTEETKTEKKETSDEEINFEI